MLLMKGALPVKLCISVNMTDPAILEMAAWLGCDFVWIDCEHSDIRNLPEMVRAAEATGIEAWVRVSKNDSHDISAALEAGALGIIVPHVASRGDAELAVKNTKWHPLGQRNWFMKSRDAKYGITPGDVFRAQRNQTAKLIAQIEDPSGVEQAMSIISTPGVDIVMTGPGDLSQAYGIPGQLTNPRVVEAEQRVFDAADTCGKPVLHFANSLQELEQIRKKHPVEYLVIGGDSALFTGALKDRIAQFR
jgi:4-hydroxy-2-oxoheptanedioate aldolase